MVRCQNPARAGPFGGCVPVQQVQDAPPAVAPVDAPGVAPVQDPAVAPVEDPAVAPVQDPVVAPVQDPVGAANSRSGLASGSVANGISRPVGRFARGLFTKEQALTRDVASGDDSEEECD
jgi:hypothetical protein